MSVPVLLTLLDNRTTSVGEQQLEAEASSQSPSRSDSLEANDCMPPEAMLKVYQTLYKALVRQRQLWRLRHGNETAVALFGHGQRWSSESSSATSGQQLKQTTPQADFCLDECASYSTEAASALPADRLAAQPSNAIDKSAASDQSCPGRLHRFVVELDADLEPHEYVGLTGDSASLGEWQLDKSLKLQSQQGRQWSGTAMLHECRDISYRYFIYVEDKRGHKQIRRWETQVQPRLLKKNTPREAKAEETRSERIDYFGQHDGESEAAKHVKRGWLTKERIVQLKLERQRVFQVLDINRFDPENIRVQVVPLRHEDPQTAVDQPAEGIAVEVAKWKYGESVLQPQQAFGATYTRGDVVIFHVTVPTEVQCNFGVVFYTPDYQLMGQALIRAEQLTGSEGFLDLPIRQGGGGEGSKAIAHLHLPYLIVHPFDGAELDFRTTYAHYWPKSWPNLDVGHRGNGKSYIHDPPQQRENTIASFLSVYENHGDMIELDVHLTADGVPIIYHDFGVKTAPAGKQVSSAEQLEYVLIKDLTYEEVKELRVFAVVHGKPVEFPAHNRESRPEHRIFPTLADVLRGTPPALGIDVEIKWPQRKQCGAVEAEQTIDKNFFIDRVLATIIEHGCGRPLLFSSFDADVCTMLRFKQNRFPVLFLTMGETKKWEPFIDLRTRNFEHAVNMAQAFELAGTAPHAEDFVAGQRDGGELMQLAHNLGQMTLVWGDDVNSAERVKFFSEIGATAICYDRIDLHITADKERAFFNSTTLLAEFGSQCRRGV